MIYITPGVRAGGSSECNGGLTVSAVRLATRWLAAGAAHLDRHRYRARDGRASVADAGSGYAGPRTRCWQSALGLVPCNRVLRHAVFFVFAQQHAGAIRAATVTPLVVTNPVPSGRNLTAIMRERVDVTTQLAVANARRCSRDCPVVQIRRASLAAKLDALDAEAGQVRRQHARDDRVMEQRDALTADPVTARLATLLGTTVVRVDLMSGLAFAAVLEGVACLLWMLALPSRPPASPVPSVAMPVTAGHEPPADSHTAVSTPVTSSAPGHTPASELAQLARDVAAGHVRTTVADIRCHLRCSQARAVALRKQLTETATSP